MAVRVRIDPLSPGTLAGDLSLPKAFIPTRPWSGPEKGAAWTAYRAYAYLAGKLTKQIAHATAEAGRRDAIANDTWRAMQAEFLAELTERQAEAAALREAAQSAVADVHAAVLAAAAPSSPVEAATFAAIWQHLARPATGSEQDLVAHRSRLVAIRADAIAAKDLTTLRAFASAPAVFGLDGLGDPVQAQQAQALLAPEALAAVAQREAQLQSVEGLVFQVDALAADLGRASRDSIGALAEDLASRERRILSGSGSWDAPLAPVETDASRSGFPGPHRVADPRSMSTAA